ncbi:unnamed protein product [Danaus chrysippus]|uniref:(African queen) hypothetical protein n=1 Tax=Danaus chrysippus TaxID=151541 RepID=A0A8J2W4Z7_9NEOP|nr:unnamed protein product [Danaus chrysippus]
MLTKLCNLAVYSATFLSLFAIDYVLGNGLTDIIQKFGCKMFCLVKSSINEESKKVKEFDGEHNSSNFPVLCVEIMCLGATIVFLNKYKQIRGKDRIDELLQESREALRQTNEFLEKWRLRRVPKDCSYLDEEPQEITPLKLEVPILHMAIVDTLGTTRNQPERGDAGDTINITDSTLLSMTSILNDDLEMITDHPLEDSDTHSFVYANRGLWDLLEEDLVSEN